MTPNLPGRRAAFVRHVLAGMSPKNAATAAGYSPTSAGPLACRLIRDPAIRAALENAATLRQEILTQADEIRRLAVERGDAGAAITALKLRCSITGLVA